MVFLIEDILQAMQHPRRNLVRLNDLEIVHGAFGNKDYAIGNNVVIFHVLWRGGSYAMRCYRRRKPYLKELYNDSYLPKELNVGKGCIDRMVDVVLCDWVEGSSLSRCVEKAIQMSDHKRLSELAKAFDRMALSLIEADWAHGDLSPDNIIVDRCGELHLIDLDARYIPELKGCESGELGTSAYQPIRTKEDFGARMDDFSIAVISTSLHALSLDPTLKSKFPFMDGLLFDGKKINDKRYEVINYLQDLFCREGYFSHYRIMKLLKLSTLEINYLPDLLRVNVDSEARDIELELFIEWGICGYYDRGSGEVIIPPLYDEAFEFRGDFALVRLDRWWFYIDKSGRAVESCGECRERKPSKIRMQS